MSFNRSVRRVLRAGTLSLLLLNTGFADARKDHEQERVREALRRGTLLPLAQILTIVTRHAPGNIIKIELEHDDAGTMLYSIKVLGEDGRVRKFRLPACRPSAGPL